MCVVISLQKSCQRLQVCLIRTALMMVYAKSVGWVPFRLGPEWLCMCIYMCIYIYLCIYPYTDVFHWHTYHSIKRSCIYYTIYFSHQHVIHNHLKCIFFLRKICNPPVWPVFFFSTFRICFWFSLAKKPWIEASWSRKRCQKTRYSKVPTKIGILL